MSGDRIWAVAAGFALFVTARVLSAGSPSVALTESSSAAIAQEEIAISVAVTPADAKILVDGEPRSRTFSLPKTYGRHTIEISAAGYVSYHGTLNGSRGADLVVSLSRADTTRRKHSASSRPPAEQTAEHSEANGTTPSAETAEVDQTDISANRTGTATAGSNADQPEPQPSAATRDEHASPEKKKWVDPFADEPNAKAEAPPEKKWVDPFSQ